MTTITFGASINIDARKITDQIVTALEGGSGYWMASFKPAGGDIKTNVSPWYDDEKIWAGNFDIEVKVHDEDIVPGQGDAFHFTPESVNKGLQWLLNNHAWRIEQIVKESGDAETADVFLQACLFEDIVYG
jgi:hypothetical protein